MTREGLSGAYSFNSLKYITAHGGFNQIAGGSIVHHLPHDGIFIVGAERQYLYFGELFFQFFAVIHTIQVGQAHVEHKQFGAPEGNGLTALAGTMSNSDYLGDT